MTVAFDLDGTLIDSMPQLEEFGSWLIYKHYGASPHEARRAYRSTVGMSYLDQLDALFPLGGNRMLNFTLWMKFKEHQRKIYETVDLFPDVIPSLIRLRDAQVNCFVVSGSPRALTIPVLDRLLPSEFGRVYGSEDGSKIKQIEHIVTTLADVTVIGDAPHDAAYAHEAGAKFIGLSTTFHEEAFEHDCLVVKSLTEAVDEVLEAPLRSEGVDEGNPIHFGQLSLPGLLDDHLGGSNAG